jgi:glycosyltransferase involved in cell wall biosynthesis
VKRLDDVCVVIPTIGRESLSRLLMSLSEQPVSVGRIVVVDDRSRPEGCLPVPIQLANRTTVLASGGRGPAAARNAGWRATGAPWVVFVDDDVVTSPTWSLQLEEDLRVAAEVGAVQGRIVVPLPVGRRPTDRERNVAGLEHAPWITADLAVRRLALEDVGGFDERFRRAYREDSDLALRLQGRGWRLARGERCTQHPVQPAPWWSSVTAQRGNRDDALMRALHGRRWRPERGRRSRHAAITGAALASILLAATGHYRLAAVAVGAWFLGTAEFAGARVAPGPRTLNEVASMVATSVAIPPAAISYWVAGRVAHRPGRTFQWPLETTSYGVG